MKGEGDKKKERGVGSNKGRKGGNKAREENGQGRKR